MLNIDRFKRSSLFLSFVLACFAIFLSGCVNVEQKTILKSDGSGSMTVHYWTKMSNVTSSTEVGSFSFAKDKAKSNYTSSNSEVTNVDVKDNLTDSTKHVTLELKFKNINDLPSAKGFEKIKVLWKEGKEGMDFSYTLPKDTSNSKNMGASDTKLTYTFELPSEVLSTNGRKDGQTVIWEKSLADLSKDIEMTATVKSKSGKCGLFGIELPLIIFVGLAVMSYGRRRRK